MHPEPGALNPRVNTYDDLIKSYAILWDLALSAEGTSRVVIRQKSCERLID